MKRHRTPSIAVVWLIQAKIIVFLKSKELAWMIQKEKALKLPEHPVLSWRCRYSLSFETLMRS
jgi:hypothetical protein